MNWKPWIVAAIVFIGWYALTADWSRENVQPRPDDQKQVKPVVPSKLAVLIVEETDDRHKLPQYAGVFASSRIRDYLNKKGHKWRWVDKDVDPATLDDFWRSAMEQAKGKPLPYLGISNGAKGTEGLLPSNEDEGLSLLKKWGGE